MTKTDSRCETRRKTSPARRQHAFRRRGMLLLLTVAFIAMAAALAATIGAGSARLVRMSDHRHRTIMLQQMIDSAKDRWDATREERLTGHDDEQTGNGFAASPPEHEAEAAEPTHPKVESRLDAAWILPEGAAGYVEWKVTPDGQLALTAVAHIEGKTYTRQAAFVVN